ncbi:MAG: DUF4097 family beta strand repeat protein [Acidobacteria bacterium]|nr:DUF4097 family beta strand repeat protein [Acidobacteriota bacterium]
MIDMRILTALLVTAIATAPLGAADTPAPRDTDARRAGWLDRFADARQGPEQTDRVVQAIQVGPGGALDLSNISGSVRVTGDGGAEIRIEATRRVRHRDADEARRLLQQLRVDITTVGGRVEVRTTYPRRSGPGGDRVSASVDYVVSVPADADVAVKTISGDVNVVRVNGDVRAEAVSGDVEVTATPNLAVAKTVSGDVTAREVSAAGGISLGSVSGTVAATGLKARSLECGSVSGDVQLSSLEVERLQVKSVSGGILFQATLARGGRYDLTSHSGDIRVVLGSDTGFELDASTFSGSVRSDFPVTLRPARRAERGRGAETRTIRGSYGDASAILVAQTFSGTVVIGRK